MHEFIPPGPEYPTQPELQTLFADAQSWLVANRPLYLAEPDRNRELATHDGLPVVYDGPPYHGMSISGEVVHDLLPTVAEELDLMPEDTLQIHYFIPCHRLLRPGEYDMSPASFVVGFEKNTPAQDGFGGVDLVLEPDENSGMQFIAEAMYRIPQPQKSPAQALLEPIINGRPSPDADYPQYMAARRVVDNLQELANEMEARGLHMVLDGYLQQAEQEVQRAANIALHTVGQLDEARAVLLAPCPNDAPMYTHLNKFTVGVMGLALAACIQEAKQPEVHLSRQWLRRLPITFSEATIRAFAHQEEVAYELTLTLPPDPEAILQGVDRIDEIITIYQNSYVRQVRNYDADGECVAENDLTNTMPLEDQHDMLFAILARNRDTYS